MTNLGKLIAVLCIISLVALIVRVRVAKAVAVALVQLHTYFAFTQTLAVRTPRPAFVALVIEAVPATTAPGDHRHGRHGRLGAFCPGDVRDL